jgi:hypothetical protein
MRASAPEHIAQATMKMKVFFSCAVSASHDGKTFWRNFKLFSGRKGQSVNRAALGLSSRIVRTR